MAKLQVMTLENLQAYDPLIKGYVTDAIGESEAKSLKTVTLVDGVLKFYRVEEPVGDTTPAYELELPETDISGLLAKLTGATEGDVVVANADGTVKDGGVKLADLALKSEVTALADGQVAANKTAIEAINNADTGILKTAKDYADEKVQALADGAVKTNADAIAKLDGDVTTDGSVKKQIKDAIDVVDGKIGTLADLDTTAKTDLVGAINEVRQAVETGGTGSVVSIDTSTTTEGYLKTYTIKQGTTEVGKIDIPKDIFAVSGSVVTNPDADHTGTFVKLVLENQEEPIYIDVASLIENYTAQTSATQVQLAIDNDTREISATIVAGSITATELAADAVTTSKIADGNVTLSKLGSDVTPTLTQVGTNKTNIEALQAIVGEGVEAISTDAINALFS